MNVGDRVKVIRKIEHWDEGVVWVYPMNKTIGKSYKIIKIANFHDSGASYKLETNCPHNYWYPAESLYKVGKQLLFSFMEE